MSYVVKALPLWIPSFLQCPILGDDICGEAGRLLMLKNSSLWSNIVIVAQFTTSIGSLKVIAIHKFIQVFLPFLIGKVKKVFYEKEQ